MALEREEPGELHRWCLRSPEVFGWALGTAIDDAIKAGTISARRFKGEDPPSAVNWLRTSHPTLATWESGEHVPDLDTFKSILEKIVGFQEELTRLKRIPEDPDDPARYPVQGPRQTNLWKEHASDTRLNTFLNDDAWAWLLPWPGLTVNQVLLNYDTPRYEMPRCTDKVYARWKQENPGEFADYSDEVRDGWGTKVRLEGVIRSSGHGEPEEYTIRISPARFLHYASIQARLWKRERELIKLRDRCFENALTALAIAKARTLVLPSVFAIHMAVVTRAGQAVLRQRPFDAPMFPDAWEGSVGEMMHGPAYNGEFKHFENGKPSLGLFLKMALVEELGYDLSIPCTFRLYGFAAEYASLAPKLIVVCQTDADAGPLAAFTKSKPEKDDRAKNAAVIDLSIEGITAAFRRYPSWGPTSKLALTLALLETATEDKDHILVEISRRLSASLPT